VGKSRGNHGTLFTRQTTQSGGALGLRTVFFAVEKRGARSERVEGGGDTGQHGGEGRRRVRNSNNKKIETARGNTQNDEGQYTNSRRIRTFGNAEGQGGGLRGVEASATGAGTAGYWRNTSQRQKEGGEEGRRGWGQKRRSESHRTDGSEGVTL